MINLTKEVELRVRELVAAAPPLTTRQRDVLALIFTNTPAPAAERSAA